MLSEVLDLSVIKPGILIRSETGVILDARSTVTLLRCESNIIIVDTALLKDRLTLIKALDARDISLEDVDTIINTHFHTDHIGNNEIFINARVYAHHSCDRGSNLIKIRKFPFFLTPNVEIIETPGHSWDSITVLVKLDKTYAITGDSIPIKGNYDQWIPPIVHVDRVRALESMQQIVERADVIIPGHDAPFEIRKEQ